MNSTSGLLADMSPRVWQMAGMELWQGAIWLKMMAQQTVSKTFEYSQIWGIGFWGLAQKKKITSRKNGAIFHTKKNSSYPSIKSTLNITHQPQELNLMTHVFHLQPFCKPENINRFNISLQAFSPTELLGEPPLESLTGLHLRLRCADFQLRPAFRFTSFTLCFLLLPWMVSSHLKGDHPFSGTHGYPRP